VVTTEDVQDPFLIHARRVLLANAYKYVGLETFAYGHAAMSGDLPTEIIKYVIALLHDDLLKCTQGLFSRVEKVDPSRSKTPFQRDQVHGVPKFRGWKKTLPDAKNSLAHLVRSLEVGFGTRVVSKADSEWIRSFANVERLVVWRGGYTDIALSNGPFIPFGAISSVKSLSLRPQVLLPSSEITQIIRSFPPL
jgi:hypothetical protein